MTEKRNITIQVPVLARVEGEGALDLTIRDGAIDDLQLRIYEPPRLFEQFVCGHSPDSVLDMVARICGICPVAYQMTAVQALEQAFNIKVSDWVEQMRRVFYCGEWLQSHALHIHLLAAPDFLGFNNVAEMATRYADEVRRGLRLQTLGNDLIALFGGRSVHPVVVCVGGFYHAATAKAVSAMRERLLAARDEGSELIQWTASLPLPDQTQAFVSVALQEPDRFAMNHGRIVSSNGLDIDVTEYEQHFREFQAPHSTALHALLHDQPFLVGPLARLNLNQHALPATLQDQLGQTGIRFPSQNMFHSIVARAAEIWLIINEAIDLLEHYQRPDATHSEWQPRAGTGIAATEAPRGLLWHRYDTNADSTVTRARIVPPTSQNQAQIEADLRQSLQSFGLDQDDQALRLRGEMVIRNYDPCISCATHFLRLNVTRD